MYPRLSRIALLATVVLVALPSFALAANAPIEYTTDKEYPEDYESFSTTGVNPTSPWGTYTTAGTGTYLVATGSACTGTRCLAVADTVSATFAVDFNNDGTGVNLCTTGQSVTFSFALSAGITLNQVWHARVATAGPSALANPANTIDIAITGSLASTEAVTIVLNSNTGTQTPVSLGSYTAPGVVGVTLDTMNCVGSTPSIHYSVLGGGLSATGTFTANSLVSGDFDSLQIASSSTALPSNTVDLDNIRWQHAPLPAPTISGINPTQGPAGGGQAFTVTGTGFKSGAQVAIGGAQATGEAYPDGSTITGVTPAHGSGLVSVVVTNPDGQTATLTNAYTYNPAPTTIVDALSPNRGKIQGGDTIAVSGSNFNSGFTATFDTTPAFSTHFTDSSHVEVVTPPHAEGAVTFTLTNPDSQSDTASFTYFTPDSGGGDPGPDPEPQIETTTITNLVPSGDNLAVSRLGDTVLAAWAQPGSGILVAVSQDGGATWPTITTTGGTLTGTAGTFLLKSAVIDSQNMVIGFVQDGTNTPHFLYTANGGTTWATSASAGTITPDQTDLKCGFGKCVWAQRFSAGTDHAPRAFVSTNNGVTWAATASNPDAVGSGSECNGNNDNCAVFGITVIMQSATGWTVLFDKDSSSFGNVQLAYSVTTDSGTTWSTGARLNNMLSPLNGAVSGTQDWGYGVKIDDDYYTDSAFHLVFKRGGTVTAAHAVGSGFVFQGLAGTYSAHPQIATCSGQVAVAYTPTDNSGRIVLAYLKDTDTVGPTVESTLVVDPGTTGADVPVIMFDDGVLFHLFYKGTDGKLKQTVVPCSSGGSATAVGFSKTCTFCADRSSEHFAYNYEEGVSFETDDAQMNLQDSYQFSADDDNFDYLGKVIPGEAFGAKTFFTLEADTDSLQSIFRVDYSFVGHATYNTATALTDGTFYLTNGAKGNGVDSGVFNEYVEAKFKEVGNDWAVSIWSVEAGGSRTMIGTTSFGDSPGKPQSYVLTVDTRESGPYVSITHADGSFIGSGLNNALNMTMDQAGLDTFIGRAITGQWFIGASGETGINSNVDVNTWLNNNDDDPGNGGGSADDTPLGSTCIYLLGARGADGALVNPPPASGSTGPTLIFNNETGSSVPEGFLPPGAGGNGPEPGAGEFGAAGSFFLPDDAVLPSGFTRSTFSFLLGILFMFFLAAGTYFALGKNAVAGAIGGGAGFMGAFAFGLFPLWAVLLVALVCAAIMVLRFRGGGG